MADSPKNPRISVVFFCSNVSGVRGKRLSIRVFRLVTSEFFSVLERHRRSAYEQCEATDYYEAKTDLTTFSTDYGEYGPVEACDFFCHISLLLILDTGW